MAFNTWSASYALMHVLEGLHGSDQYALAILDRGLFDALAWFELLTTRNTITEQERDQVQSFLQIEHWRKKIDAVLLFTTDPQTSMIRENSDKLIDEPGQAMNETFLTQLNEAYAKVERRFSSSFSGFTRIDTSSTQETTPLTTATGVVDTILNIFEASPIEES